MSLMKMFASAFETFLFKSFILQYLQYTKKYSCCSACWLLVTFALVSHLFHSVLFGEVATNILSKSILSIRPRSKAVDAKIPGNLGAPIWVSRSIGARQGVVLPSNLMLFVPKGRLW